jgi:hypothetical protein
MQVSQKQAEGHGERWIFLRFGVFLQQRAKRWFPECHILECAWRQLALCTINTNWHRIATVESFDK